MDYIGIIKQRKIISGKLYHRYFIDSAGKEVGIPPYVYLIKKQGYFYVAAQPNKRKHPDSFYVLERYSNAITQELAMLRVVAIIRTMMKGKQVTAPGAKVMSVRTSSIERLGLDLTEIPSGVCVNLLNNKRQEFVSIGVSYFDLKEKKFKVKAFYVGTLNTWKGHYPAKLQEAITLREESLKLYNELTKVN